MYYLIVFKSRQEAISYKNKLKAFRINSSTVNTPRQIQKSCGISVKIYKTDLNSAMNVLDKFNYSSVTGIYRMNSDNTYTKV